MPPLHLADVEQIKQVVVDPLIAVVRSEMRLAMQPLIDDAARLRQLQESEKQRIDQIEQRIGALERFKMKIAAVCSGIAILTGIVWRMALDWFKAHLPKMH